MESRRILVVDDEPAIVNALSVLLAQAGYEVTAARSGPEALALLAPRPDLIILDLMLPEMDGYEVCRRLRQSPDYIPVLMLTARDEPVDKLLGLELGADLYLTKPFEPRELLAHIKAIFRLLDHRRDDSQPHKEMPLLCGPLVLWDTQHRVELAGQAVEVTPKEYELLRLFMRQPGRVFGRETLLREIWGYDFPGDSRVVDVHIQRLRAKIEPDPAQPRLLQTVRGFGYRFIVPSEEEAP